MCAACRQRAGTGAGTDHTVSVPLSVRQPQEGKFVRWLVTAAAVSESAVGPARSFARGPGLRQLVHRAN